MKMVMDKLLNNIKFDKKYVLFSLIITIIGIITGSLFIVILNTADKTIIIEYISDFINSFKSDGYNYMEYLKNILISNYAVLFLLSIFGFSFFFSFLNIIILFYKSFVIGFSLSSFILVYKFKGILLSIVYLFPHYIINILIFAILTAFTLKISLVMIKYIIKKKEVNMRKYFNKYLYILILLSIVLFLTSMYEIFIIPYLFKLVLKIL